MELNTLVKRLRKKMRMDSGVSGDAQRIEQMTWILFLKIYDAKEIEWEILDDDYRSIIPDEYRWRNWAIDKKDGKAATGPELLSFIDAGLFPAMKNLHITETTPIKQAIVRSVFEDINNYMKNGVLLREVINIIDEVDFTKFEERHTFNDIYEALLKELQAQGSSGEYYTPRAVTDFMVRIIDPKLGESVADFACGTGGFLTSTLKYLDDQIETTDDKNAYGKSIFGIEKKPFPYLLCITNMILHDVDSPLIIHGNTLEKNYRDYTDNDRYNVILMNPPYGGSEMEIVKSNFPSDLRSNETADLFINVIMYRLKKNGRAAVILPDGFLFGDDDGKTNIKKKLLSEFNLHTIIRMTNDVFAPYTNIRTNILFFDNTHPTESTWIYRMDMPEGYKHFSKTKPIKIEHFKEVIEWWNDRKEILVEKSYKSKCYTIKEITEGNYNLNLCGFPQEIKEILPPDEIIRNYREERAKLTSKIDELLDQIETALGGNDES
jgi:type I restriction enzyme M protein